MAHDIRSTLNKSRHPQGTSGSLEVHLAEYSVLSGRCTAWLSLMVPIWAILATFLAVIAVCWSLFSDHVVLAWTLGIGGQLVLLMWFQTIEEQYRAVIYIQTKLRPRIQKLISGSKFWTYESYSAGRDDFLSWWGEWFGPSLVLILLVVILVIRKNLQIIDYVGVSANVLLFIIQILKTITRVRLRLQIAKADDR